MTISRLFLAWFLPAVAAQTPIPFSLEKEAALGKQLDGEFRGNTRAINDPEVQKYLDRLGQRIAAQMPAVRLPFTFSTILDDPCSATHEPVTLPGGYVYVSSSLFLAAQNEDEFAGMLAHAMEHILQRHGMRELAAPKDSSIPLVFVRGFFGTCSAPIPQGVRTSQQSNELEADALAILVMARASFDPRAFERYIERVQALPAQMNGYSLLPDRSQRLAAMMAAIGQLGKIDQGAGSSSEFAVAQQRVREFSAPPPRSDAPPSLVRKTAQ